MVGERKGKDVLTKAITVNMTEEEHAYVMRKAERLGWSKNKVMRKALEWSIYNDNGRY